MTALLRWWRFLAWLVAAWVFFYLMSDRKRPWLDLIVVLGLGGIALGIAWLERKKGWRLH